MRGDAEAYQPAAAVTQDHQTIEEFEKRSRHDEQINRSNTRRMVAQEGLPILRRRSSGPGHHVFRDGRLCDLDSEHEQLAMNAEHSHGEDGSKDNSREVPV